MRYLPVTYSRIELLADSLSPNRRGVRRDERRSGLDGRTFAGHLSATGWLGWIGRDATLLFAEGKFVWSCGINDGYQPAVYSTRRKAACLEFNARAHHDGGDYVDWAGRFEGERLKDVTAVWTRLEHDLVHDLFLPDTVTFVFEVR